MCGRFYLSTPAEAVAALFGLDRVRMEDVRPLPGHPRPAPLAPRYNIAPTQLVAVVREVEEGGGKGGGEGGGAGTARRRVRELAPLRWGLVPYWAEDPAIGARMINARAESASGSNAFRHALERRRCLVPADGFYEWKKTGARSKQPMAIRSAGGRPLALAGLWERWLPPRERAAAGRGRSPGGGEGRGTASDGAEGEGEGGAGLSEGTRGAAWLETVTILTCPPNELLRDVHDRMPVILEPGEWDRWLDPSVRDPAAVVPLLDPYPAGEMRMHAVSTRVNRVEHDGPECVEEVRPEGPAPEAQGTLF